MFLAIIIFNGIHAFASERISSKNLHILEDIIIQKNKKIAVQDILVVFDFDNTLMAMNQDIGSDQWYNWQSKVIAENNKKEKMFNSKSELFEAHYKIFALGSMHPVEADTVKIVKKIQNQKIKTFILTSRGSGYRNDTEMELDQVDLSFKESSVGPEGGYPSRFIPEGTDLKKEISYMDGILMGSGQDKGILLKYILDKTKTKFKVIIFIDDTLKNIENVEESFKESVDLVTVYYTHEQERVDQLDKNKKNILRDWKKIKKTFDYFNEDNRD